MGDQISKEEAWDILIKPNKEELLKNFGTDGLRRIKEYFLNVSNDLVDTNDVEVHKRNIRLMLKTIIVN